MKNTRRFLSICIVLVLFASILAPLTLHAQEVTVTVNGRAVNFDGQAPMIIDGRTFVPLRGVFEALGFTVGWDGLTRTASLTGRGYVTNIGVGSYTFTVNNRVIALEAPAQNISGRVLLPLRVVLENMGFQVEWNAASREVVVVDPHFTVATHDITDQIRGVATTIATGNSGSSWSPYGINASYAIMEDGSLWVWGGRQGYIPANPPYFDGVPGVVFNEPIKVMDNVERIAGGVQWNYAIRSDSSLWYISMHGRFLLNSGLIASSAFTHIGLMEDIAYVSVGNGHTMIIDTGGTLWAWGCNEYGQLGDGTTFVRHSPVMVLDDVVAVSAGSTHTIALRGDGSLWAWGSNAEGQFGNGTTIDSHIPIWIMDGVRLP